MRTATVRSMLARPTPPRRIATAMAKPTAKNCSAAAIRPSPTRRFSGVAVVSRAAATRRTRRPGCFSWLLLLFGLRQGRMARLRAGSWRQSSLWLLAARTAGHARPPSPKRRSPPSRCYACARQPARWATTTPRAASPCPISAHLWVYTCTTISAPFKWSTRTPTSASTTRSAISSTCSC